MNRVYESITSTAPLTPAQLAMAANTMTDKALFLPEYFEGEKSRISGKGHCNCGGNGEFVLLSVSECIESGGEKRYMQCRKCGGYSHL